MQYYYLLNNINLLLNVKKLFFITFLINKTYIPNYEIIIVQFCDKNEECNNDKCQKITKAPNIRYLGIIFDQHLRWDIHVSNATTYSST